MINDEDQAKQQAAHLARLQTQAEQTIRSEAAPAVSFSWLRKRFSVDYATAVHLMDGLEMAGVIGSADRGREVLAPGGFSIFD